MPPKAAAPRWFGGIGHVLRGFHEKEALAAREERDVEDKYSFWRQVVLYLLEKTCTDDDLAECNLDDVEDASLLRDMCVRFLALGGEEATFRAAVSAALLAYPRRRGAENPAEDYIQREMRLREDDRAGRPTVVVNVGHVAFTVPEIITLEDELWTAPTKMLEKLAQEGHDVALNMTLASLSQFFGEQESLPTELKERFKMCKANLRCAFRLAAVIAAAQHNVIPLEAITLLYNIGVELAVIYLLKRNVPSAIAAFLDVTQAGLQRKRLDVAGHLRKALLTKPNSTQPHPQQQSQQQPQQQQQQAHLPQQQHQNRSRGRGRGQGRGGRGGGGFNIRGSFRRQQPPYQQQPGYGPPQQQTFGQPSYPWSQHF